MVNIFFDVTQAMFTFQQVFKSFQLNIFGLDFLLVPVKNVFMKGHIQDVYFDV